MPDCNDKHSPDDKDESKGCMTFTYQSATVSVPVTVKPKVSTGDTNTFCCGEPRITPSLYKTVCKSKPESCSFILTQNICIEIPIEFSADAFVDCPHIECCNPISNNV